MQKTLKSASVVPNIDNNLSRVVGSEPYRSLWERFLDFRSCCIVLNHNNAPVGSSSHQGRGRQDPPSIHFICLGCVGYKKSRKRLLGACYLLCRINSTVADVEYMQTAFALSSGSVPANRLFFCRQAVDTTNRQRSPLSVFWISLVLLLLVILCFCVSYDISQSTTASSAVCRCCRPPAIMFGQRAQVDDV